MNMPGSVTVDLQDLILQSSFIIINTKSSPNAGLEKISRNSYYSGYLYLCMNSTSACEDFCTCSEKGASLPITCIVGMNIVLINF